MDFLCFYFPLFCIHWLMGEHILIVDDVLTTGATTTACADALKDVGGVHVSILTLAVAGS